MSVGPLTKKQVGYLRNISRVADVENDGMEDDRFFVHLRVGFHWKESDPDDLQRSKAFSTYAEARTAISQNVRADHELTGAGNG